MPVDRPFDVVVNAPLSATLPKVAAPPLFTRIDEAVTLPAVKAPDEATSKRPVETAPAKVTAPPARTGATGSSAVVSIPSSVSTSESWLALPT
ncbi:MAG: hypothetical protein PGN08_00225 [Sphingomonas taxi]